MRMFVAPMIVAGSLALAACGGSGSGGESSAPPAPPPAATAPPPPPPAEPAAPAETAAAPATPAPAAAGGSDYASLTGDAAKGKRVFAQCMTCHAVQQGRNNVGPSLYNIVGRTAGTVEGFKYSSANANSGVVWTEENLFEYLENPQRYIPGTIMAFPGLRNPQDRADVIAYLKNPT